MFKTIQKMGFAAGLMMSMLATAGCIPLIVGAAAGAGGYAYVRGVLVKQFDVSASDLHHAAIQGLKSLDLPIKYDKGDRLSAKVRSEFSDGKDVKIDIVAVTEETSQLKIRVGMVSDKLRSEMILSAIEKHL